MGGVRSRCFSVHRSDRHTLFCFQRSQLTSQLRTMTSGAQAEVPPSWPGGRTSATARWPPSLAAGARPPARPIPLGSKHPPAHVPTGSDRFKELFRNLWNVLDWEGVFNHLKITFITQLGWAFNKLYLAVTVFFYEKQQANKNTN